MKYSLFELSQLDHVAKEWLKKHPDPVVCILKGEMGVGKTTFVKAICKALHVKDKVSSPTFSLVNEYLSSEGVTVFHFDLYRLKSEEELFDLGFEEYLDQGAYVFIEWPALAREFLEEETAEVIIEIENEIRQISFY